MTTNNSRESVIITGGASGIGYAVAEKFIQKLVDAANRLAAPQQITILAQDITQAGLADQLVASARQQLGRIDVLINNAGIFRTKPFTEYTIEELDSYLGYLRGTFTLTQSVVRQMRQQGGGGAIVNIGTILALNGVAGVPSSAPIAAKGGITALTKNLSIELAADNIRINMVAPGVVPTPLYGDLTEAQRDALHGMQPLGRFGQPAEIADAVIYLANASWVTGVILPVDGGVAAGGDGTNRRRRTTALTAA
jgi:NAD(P)-dependent dehydrogenase (short-subunit alcohol dehydrogenase family)